MNWEASGAGEVAGAVGVIVTLVHLAAQIRLNNMASIYSDSISGPRSRARARIEPWPIP